MTKSPVAVVVRLLVVWTTGTLLISCAALQAPAPDKRPAETRQWEIPRSVISVPLTVAWGPVTNWTENAVPQTLEGKGTGQRTLSAWFIKHDWKFWWDYHLIRTPLVLDYKGATVRVGSSLTGELNAHWDTLPGDMSADVEAQAGVQAELSLSREWKLLSKTSTYLDVQRADVPIGIAWDGNFFGETISIAGPVQEALQPSLATLNRELNRWLNNCDLRPAAESAWKMLQTPRPIDGTDVWFGLNPETIALGGIETGPEGIRATLSLSAHPVLFWGPKPETGRGPLPGLGSVANTEPGFVLTTPVSTTWDQISQAIFESLGPDKRLNVGNGAVFHVSRLEAQTSADRVQFRLQGQVTPPWPGPAVEAVVWVSGKPEWDPNRRTLRFGHLELDVRTQDYLTKAASWLLKNSWLSDLAKVAVWDAGPAIDRLTQACATSLRSVDLGSGWKLNADLSRLEILDWSLADDGPKILGEIRGTAAISYEGRLTK